MFFSEIADVADEFEYIGSITTSFGHFENGSLYCESQICLKIKVTMIKLLLHE